MNVTERVTNSLSLVSKIDNNTTIEIRITNHVDEYKYQSTEQSKTQPSKKSLNTITASSAAASQRQYTQYNSIIVYCQSGHRSNDGPKGLKTLNVLPSVSNLTDANGITTSVHSSHHLQPIKNVDFTPWASGVVVRQRTCGSLDAHRQPFTSSVIMLTPWAFGVVVHEIPSGRPRVPVPDIIGLVLGIAVQCR